jgi:hypothetical protein
LKIKSLTLRNFTLDWECRCRIKECDREDREREECLDVEHFEKAIKKLGLHRRNKEKMLEHWRIKIRCKRWNMDRLLWKETCSTGGDEENREDKWRTG